MKRCRAGTKEKKPAKRARQIFDYFDGRRRRYADPIRLHYALVDHPKLDLQEDLARLELKDEKEAREAYESIVAAVRAVFEVKPIETAEDGKPVGLTDTECLALLTQFLMYVAELKKKVSELQTSAPPTAPVSSAAS